MAKRRRFTLSLKSEVVLEALSGQSSQAEFCQRHNLSEDQFSKWKQQVVENVASLFTSTDKHSSKETLHGLPSVNPIDTVFFHC